MATVRTGNDTAAVRSILEPPRWADDARPARHGRGLRCIAPVVLALCCAPAVGQRWNIETGVSITGSVSSNETLAPKGEEKSNAVVEIAPRISLRGSGPGGRLRVNGDLDLGGSLRTQARGEDQYSLRPQGSVNATLEAVENFFFVDASAGVQRSLTSPFQATSSTTSPINTFTSYQARISPYVQGRLPGALNYTVRSDNSWTDSGRTARQYSGGHSLLVDRAPQPFGFVVSAQHSEFDSDAQGAERFSSDVARLSLRYAPDPQYIFGVRGGWERNDYGLADSGGRTFYGVDATWRPNERTSLDAFWEDRFFGSGWQLGFNYRRPRASLNIRTSRDVSTTSQQFATFPELANLVSLLDAAFTTRFPDPIERQRVVFDFLSRQQLPAELLTPTIIFDERVSLLTSSSITLVLIGKRDNWAFTIFESRTKGIVGRTNLPTVLANNVQRGTEVTYTRRLSPVASLSTSGSWRRSEALDSSDNQTEQSQLRLEYSRQLGRRTSGSIGARYQWIDSTVTNDAEETAVFFSLSHSF